MTSITLYLLYNVIDDITHNLLDNDFKDIMNIFSKIKKYLNLLI